MQIGVIGCGVIAASVVNGIAADGPHIVVSERSTRYSKELSGRFSNVSVADNQGVVDASDVIFLGLMADASKDILARLRFRDGQRVITFMAGASLEEVNEMVRPAHAVALVIPFPGIAVGRSPVLMQGEDALVRDIFGRSNTVYPVNNAAEMAAYLSAQAVLSPVARLVGDAADWMQGKVQDTKQGEGFLRHLVSSSLENADCAALIDALNTEGGFNQRLRQHMEKAGIRTDLKTGLDGLT
ncbi:NAD(P)-binding domain-containing protein [uncultured Tateyamaria sp.]|uniref:NAD(P)-binding domain-containing protein n=1 Tax=uncultured Tateyamaria sp. TaxID=455651 RepID=UPI00261D6DAF|nr:NAD(P)-binding domain-containing protein [uncultured Tateyamaria sp.]